MINIFFNLLSSLAAALPASPQGTSNPAAQSRWLDGYCLVVDTSHYTTSIDWPALKAASIAMLWAKCSEGLTSIDDRFAATVQEAYDADIPLGAYHFFDPSYLCGGGLGEEHYPPFNLDPNDVTSPNQDAQLLNMKKALRFKKFYAISLDLERWWLDYADYYKNGSAAGKVTSVWIQSTFTRFADAVRKTWPDKELYIYSRQSFITEYVPQLMDIAWFKNNLYPIWTAQYFQPKGTVKTTWEEIRARYLPPDTVNPLTWDTGHWDFWQFTGDCFLLDGFKDGPNLSAVDISLYNGTRAHLWDRLGFTPRSVPAVTPTPSPVVTPMPLPAPPTGGNTTPAPVDATLAAVAAQVAEIRVHFR